MKLLKLFLRFKCWIRGRHWWRPYDMLSDECACCGARRTLNIRRQR